MTAINLTHRPPFSLFSAFSGFSRKRAALAGVTTLLLAACAGGPPGSGSTPGLPGLPNLPWAKPLAETTASPPADSAAEAKRPMVKDFTLTPDEVKAMLIRADPKACSASSDATLAETVALYARIGLQLGTTLLINDATDPARLQANLNAFRPHLRELSRNTNWLPQSAERLIGERIVAMNALQPFVPPARQMPLLDNTIRPIYQQLLAFAKEDLKSPVDFDLRIVRDDKSTAPAAIAGGIILVPSGLFTAMQRMKEPDSAVAFMLAHEFSHVLRRHKTKMVQLSLVDSITMADEYKQLYNSSAQGLSSAADPAKLFRFTEGNVQSLMAQTCKTRNWLPTMEQNQEFEADVCGALLLNKLSLARKTPYSAVKGYGDYLANNLATPVPPIQEGQCVVQTSHPDPARRMENLQAYAPAGAVAPPAAAAAAPVAASGPAPAASAAKPKPKPVPKPAPNPAQPAPKPKPKPAA